MKHTLRLGLVALVLASIKVHATTQVFGSCPEKFIATVTNVEDVDATAFPRVEVNFQVIQTLKGADVASKKIQIVKGGPVEFKSGEIYTIEFRDNWICSATLFSKI